MAYNGWPNYETWNVMLWLDNDEGLYRAYRAETKRYRMLERNAKELCLQLFAGAKTPDGVSLHNTKVRWGRIAEAMRED